MTDIQNIGFIELSLMGGSFAANLIKGSKSITGFGPFPAAGEAIEQQGGAMAETPGVRRRMPNWTSSWFRMRRRSKRC